MSGDRLAGACQSDVEWAIWGSASAAGTFPRPSALPLRGSGKAFGTGIRNGLAFNQFEVFNDELGKPRLRLWGEALKPAEKLGVAHMHRDDRG